jgi:hypothetical protein
MKVPTHYAFRRTIPTIAAVLTYTLLFAQFARAARPLQASAPQQTTAPVERQAPAAASMSEATAQARLLAAHNIYIVDDGADDRFPGSPAEGTHAFAASMRTWGRYNLVSTVKDADLVLQVRSGVNRAYVPSGDANYNGGGYIYSPFFRLTIAEPATLDPLWVVTVPVLTGTRKKDHADLFNVSAGNLTSQLKLLTATPLTASETADLRQPAILRHRRNALMFGLVGAGLGAGLAIFFVARHSAQSNQQAFCAAHGITPCPS